MTAPSSDAGVKKPRLVIKKMVLENFKSYAGAQHVGPFHKVRAIPATSPVLSIDAASYRDVRGLDIDPTPPNERRSPRISRGSVPASAGRW